MKEVFDFILNCKTYFLATVDGDKPRVRPFNTVNIFEDKLYFLTGKGKAISKQLSNNPNVEISAFDGECWIRIEAVAVNDDRIGPKHSMLEARPQLKDRYKEDDDNIQVLYLKDATATIWSHVDRTAAPKVYKF